jgi:gamma-glutamylcyclotransferase
LGTATLDGYQLRWHKKSSDGSGKCDIIPQPGAIVYGCAYDFPLERLRLLDEAEGVGAGYLREEIEVMLRESTTAAYTYRAQAGYTDPNLLPYDWYHAFVIHGAQLHKLPGDYQASIQEQRVKRDANEARALKARSQLELKPRGV